MKYSVSPQVFTLDPRLRFGIIIGHGLKNRPSSRKDEMRLRNAEESVRGRINPAVLRDVPNIALYRETMKKAGINPNRFPVSVEAMLKRVLKGDQLPSINALVDLCNAVSLENIITLGAHDLNDIEDDLSVRFTTGHEKFLPFGQEEEEPVEEGELVFTSGNQVQTRKWIWRQSELGKTTLNSHHIIFQLVGMADDPENTLETAMSSIEKLVMDEFGGSCTSYRVSPDNMEIEFD